MRDQCRNPPASFLINARVKRQALTSPSPNARNKILDHASSHECRKWSGTGLYPGCTKSRCATGAVALFPLVPSTPPSPRFPPRAKQRDAPPPRFSPLMNSSLCHRVIGTSHYSQSAAVLSSATVGRIASAGMAKESV